MYVNGYSLSFQIPRLDYKLNFKESQTNSLLAYAHEPLKTQIMKLEKGQMVEVYLASLATKKKKIEMGYVHTIWKGLR